MRIQGFATLSTQEGGCLVEVDGKELKLGPSLKLRNHSPTGFQWGYAGSGPAQLALALLLAAGLPKEEACDLYQEFKREFVQHWPNGWSFCEELDVRAWARRAKAAAQEVQSIAAEGLGNEKAGDDV